ncbi:MAG: hypothetical protein Q8L47_04770 [bacterium]|nr:hypothetical protein [bacterium]
MTRRDLLIIIKIFYHKSVDTQTFANTLHARRHGHKHSNILFTLSFIEGRHVGMFIGEIESGIGAITEMQIVMHGKLKKSLV